MMKFKKEETWITTDGQEFDHPISAEEHEISLHKDELLKKLKERIERTQQYKGTSFTGFLQAIDGGSDLLADLLFQLCSEFDTRELIRETVEAFDEILGYEEEV